MATRKTVRSANSGKFVAKSAGRVMSPKAHGTAASRAAATSAATRMVSRNHKAVDFVELMRDGE